MTNKNSISDNKIIVNFSLFPFCFRTVKYNEFTNKLKNYEQFFKYFKRIIEKDIPVISEYSFDEVIRATNKHSHPIQNGTFQYSLVVSIVKELCKSYYSYSDKDFDRFLENNINDYSVWQLGISGGIRRLNVFCVLFIDYHHLVYKDNNFNSESYEMYDFCPMTSAFGRNI